jgi:predicted DNA-binding transcriptional regulator AlpA
VNSTLSISKDNGSRTNRSAVTLSPWVNEPLPPFQELLSAHDVARLTRRPRLIISSLVLLRRFPKKQQFRGRRIGWLRADVLEWMARDFATYEEAKRTNFAAHRDTRRNPRQACLPLECRPPRVGKGNLP